MKFACPFLILLLSFSCQKQIKFDKDLWNSDDTDDKISYDLRYEMLDDLLENYSLKGKNIQEIEKIIGKINEKGHDDQKTQDALIYTVLIKWRGIDPVHYKYLNLHFNKQKIIDSVFISEREVD
ncbi:hypothetical protein Q73A0000_03825 [Kaistella flava (ex Peng et al. 2021)]|uniref:Uncharacterized protein n=1 Tax=Kaistella flava (ex Peng et al. 2021) TaxID=2038776 RepID=A0A7M2Y7A0_9FLAO|nr:hypothetical protein [Kaistella flava (ex Peng et al. 2021)]QOW09554.1 hypothetical protein Q73A0000_03825 [Kaistella flava (ex Peng et al. 2021)]